MLRQGPRPNPSHNCVPSYCIPVRHLFNIRSKAHGKKWQEQELSSEMSVDVCYVTPALGPYLVRTAAQAENGRGWNKDNQGEMMERYGK